MSGQIRMTPATMRERATSYHNESENLQGIISRMDGLLEQLQTEWEGAASSSYAEKYAQLKPGFEEARDLIQDISDALNKTADIVEETDNSISIQFQR